MLVTCNNCGSNLDIDDSSRFVTCSNCTKPLEVFKTNSSVYTKVRQHQSAQNTNTKVNASAAFSIQEKIEMLDNEWKNALPNYMVDGKLPNTDGNLTSAGLVLSIIFGIGILLAGLFFIPLKEVLGKIAIILMGIFTLAGAIWQLNNHIDRKAEFTKKKKEYEKKRNQLLAKK